MEQDKAINKVITSIFGESLDRKKERKAIEKNVVKDTSLRTNPKTDDLNSSGGNNKPKNVQELKRILKISKKSVIKDVNLKIKSGSKIALLGDTDSSLSSFILTLTGNSHISRGNIRAKGRIVYLDASSSPFLAGKSIKDNILMEDQYISSRYFKILKKVGLNLKNFKGQDKCEVLSGAVNFSFAERLKILLCRMLYVSGDIYIMKDVFGHDEVEIELRMYKNIVEDVLGTKTVLITTNSEELLQKVDRIFSFNKLKVIDMGDFDSFMKISEGIKDIGKGLMNIVGSTPNRNNNLAQSTISVKSNLVTPRRITQKYSIQGSDLERKADALNRDADAFLKQFGSFADQSGNVSKKLDESSVYEDLLG
jgi:ABC-type multidrug transport system fused ATPase/permease subunit